MNSKNETPEFAYSKSDMFNRSFIASQHIKGRNAEAFIINFEDAVIQVNRTNDKSSPIQVRVNGELSASVEWKKNETIDFKTFSGSHKLEVWYTRAKNFFFTNFFFKQGIAITIDGIPVQNTLADPILILDEGKVSLWIFFIILLLKGLIILQLSIKATSGFNPEQLGILIIYLIPLLLILYAGLTFSKNPSRALWFGIVLGSIETLEVLVGMISTSSYDFINIFFIGLRISCITAMIRTLKSLKVLLKTTEIISTGEAQNSAENINGIDKSVDDIRGRFPVESKLIRIAKWVTRNKKIISYSLGLIGIVFISIMIERELNKPKISRDSSLGTMTNILLPDLIPYRAKYKWDYCNKEKKIIIEPIYDDVELFNEQSSRAVVKFNGLWGLIDKNGNKITRFIYDGIDFHEKENYYWVRKGDDGLRIDAQGNQITWKRDSEVSNKLPLPFNDGNYDIIPFEDFGDLYKIRKRMPYDETTKIKNIYGIINSSGKIIVPMEYYQISTLNRGWFWISSSPQPKSEFLRVGKYTNPNDWDSYKEGVVDLEGNIVIPCIYKEISTHSSSKKDFFIVKNMNDKWGVVSMFGNVVIPFNYTFLGENIEITKYQKLKDKVDLQDEFLIEARDYNYYWGVINEFGEAVVPFKYENPRLHKFLYQNFMVCKKNNKYGLVDYSNKIIKPFNYDYIGFFFEGLAKIKIFDQDKKKKLLASKMGFPDNRIKSLYMFCINNKETSEKFDFGDLNTFTSTFGIEGKRQILFNNIKPYLFIDPLFEDESFLCSYNYEEFLLRMIFGSDYIDSLDGSCGFIDENGKEVIPPIYDVAYYFEDGLAEVKLNGKWGMINKNGQVVISIKYDEIENKLEVPELIEVKINGRKGYVDLNGVEYFE